MITPADMLRWTGLTVSEEDCAVFGSVAEARLAADGGSALPQAVKTMLMCYLVASFNTVQTGNTFAQSESIGGYSYTKRSSSSTSNWIDLYWENLKSYKAAASSAAGGKGGIVRHSVDESMVRMNRTYGGGTL